MSEKLIAYLFPFLKFDKLLLCNFQRTFRIIDAMEIRRFELLTPCLQGRCSPN